jgi:GT2 family glycosyltransferase
MAGVNRCRCSVVLATYNRRELLGDVLAPILADPAADEVVVVVDGCRDGSLELLCCRAREDPRIKPVFIANSGAARALVRGAREATGEILVILDDDEIVDPGTIGAHLAHHRHDGGVVVVGYVAMHLPRARRRGDFSRYMYAHQYERDCAAWEADSSTILGNLWGGYISIRRADYLGVMGDAEAFVDGYHYDLDFGARCLELGLRAVFDRSLRAHHLYQRDRAGFLRDARSSGRNRILVHHAHPGALGPLEATFVDAGLPPLGRAAMRFALRRRSVERLVGAATTVAGLLHLWRLETLGAALMWAIEQKRGALQATRELAGRQRAAEPANR